jgi:hypothetical protein
MMLYQVIAAELVSARLPIAGAFSKKMHKKAPAGGRAGAFRELGGGEWTPGSKREGQ